MNFSQFPLNTVFCPPLLILFLVVVPSLICPVGWTPTCSLKPSSNVSSPLEPFLILLFSLPGRIKPSLLSTLNKHLYCKQLVNFLFRPGMSKLWPMGEIWPVAYFCTLCELRTDFTFSNCWEKKGENTIFCHIKIGDSIMYCVWFLSCYNGRTELLWQRL